MRSVYYGLHYFVGREKRPRVIEAHACLVVPTAMAAHRTAAGAADGAAAAAEGGAGGGAAATAGGAALDADDRWVLSTFDALERRVNSDGVRTGTTMMLERG